MFAQGRPALRCNREDGEKAMRASQANERHIAAAQAHEAAAEAHRAAARLLAAGDLMGAVQQTHAADRRSAQASEASAMADFCVRADATGNVRGAVPQPDPALGR